MATHTHTSRSQPLATRARLDAELHHLRDLVALRSILARHGPTAGELRRYDAEINRGESSPCSHDNPPSRRKPPPEVKLPPPGRPISDRTTINSARRPPNRWTSTKEPRRSQRRRPSPRACRLCFPTSRRARRCRVSCASERKSQQRSSAPRGAQPRNPVSTPRACRERRRVEARVRAHATTHIPAGSHSQQALRFLSRGS